MRIGAEADTDLTKEFLLNMPEEYSANETFQLVFTALAPDQQVNALINLQKIFENKEHLDAVELVTYLEGELAGVMNFIFPDIMERITFWQSFLDNTNNYREFQNTTD